jgi:hypothetical protein
MLYSRFYLWVQCLLQLEITEQPLMKTYLWNMVHSSNPICITQEYSVFSGFVYEVTKRYKPNTISFYLNFCNKTCLCLRYRTWCLDMLTHCAMMNIVRLNNTSISLHSCQFLQLVKKLKMYSIWVFTPISCMGSRKCFSLFLLLLFYPVILK